jgi:hypothetical protein
MDFFLSFNALIPSILNNTDSILFVFLLLPLLVSFPFLYESTDT